MTKLNTQQITVIDVDIASWIRKPAVTSRPNLYLIKGKARIGEVRVSSSRQRDNGLIDYVSVNPVDDVTREYFKDDEVFHKTGMLFLKFDGVFGDRWLTGQDGDDPRYTDLRVVDKLDFDFGICHHFFSDVEGFDSYHKERNRLRIHTKHKARKNRNSRKIKKVDQTQYLYVSIGMSSPEYREELFSKIEYTDVYKWYVNLDGSENPRGDHDIVVRVSNKSRFLSILEDLEKKYQYKAEVVPATVLSTSALHVAVARINEKYTEEDSS